MNKQIDTQFGLLKHRTYHAENEKRMMTFSAQTNPSEMEIGGWWCIITIKMIEMQSLKSIDRKKEPKNKSTKKYS